MQEKSPTHSKQKTATVCLEGYKISSTGKCIKDKKYTTIISSIPTPPSKGSEKKGGLQALLDQRLKSLNKSTK